jgi:hypothetical protein
LDGRLIDGSWRTGKSELDRELEKDRRLCKLETVIQMDEGIEWKEREIAARVHCLVMEQRAVATTGDGSGTREARTG